MALQPTDQQSLIRALAQQVDQLSGTVAVLMAHVAHITGDEFTEDDFRAVQGAAQQMAPDPIGPGIQGVPKLHASRGAERLWSMVKTLRATPRDGR